MFLFLFLLCKFASKIAINTQVVINKMKYTTYTHPGQSLHIRKTKNVASDRKVAYKNILGFAFASKLKPNATAKKNTEAYEGNLTSTPLIKVLVGNKAKKTIIKKGPIVFSIIMISNLTSV